MFRAIVGPFGLLLVAALLQGALDCVPWEMVARQWQAGRVGPGVEAILRAGVEGPACVLAVVAMLASILILAWPPSEKRRNSIRGVEGGRTR